MDFGDFPKNEEILTDSPSLPSPHQRLRCIGRWKPGDYFQMSGDKTDAELVSEARRGKRAAQDQLARRWSARILAVCRARVGRAEAAEDLAQESLLRALEHLEALKSPERFGAWLHGIAVRVCLDWQRRQARQRRSFTSLSESGREVPDNGFHGNELSEVDDERRHLTQAIESLPDELRETLLLFYYDDMTYQQIADMLGVSRATVNSRLARSREILARSLAARAR